MKKVKIIHTSDWHLGKRLYQEGRASEHEAFLEWLLDLAATEDVNVLLFSGDLFDSPTPPHSALKMYYDFLARWFAASPEREAFILGGNHDSGQLLDAPENLEAIGHLQDRLHLIGAFKPDQWSQYVIKRPWGTVCALPYFRLPEMIALAKILAAKSAENEASESEELLKTLEVLMHKWRELAGADKPRLLMAHHVFGPFSASGSELGVPLSGLESIGLSSLGPWDYVALGHIHKPQTMTYEGCPIVYSGSPLRMRFSEHEQKKISLLEVEDGKIISSWREIPLFRKLYRLRATPATLSAKLAQLKAEENQKTCALPSFIEAELECESPWPGASDEIRAYLDEHFADENTRPKLLSLSFKIKGEMPESAEKEEGALDFGRLNFTELFKRFYLERYSDATEVPPEILDTFHELLTSEIEDEEKQEGPHVH